KVAFIVRDMMRDVVERGTATAIRRYVPPSIPVAGKTGTTNDGADVWYVGYTADLVAGVWMGFDKPKKIMANAQGGRLAAPAFTQLMMEVYRRKPAPPDWPRPESVVTAAACGENGWYSEYFLAGTESDNGCGGISPDLFRIPTPGDTVAAGLGAAARVPPGAAIKPKAKADTANPFKIPDAP
ncbi:MAG: penicillin-binding transpeptidase domain-containing protein, partial [Gemmatimonadota bacterium]